jgi:competence protein ComEA
LDHTKAAVRWHALKGRGRFAKLVGTLIERPTMPQPQPPTEQPKSPRLVLRRMDQAVTGALTAVSLVAILGWCAWQGRLRGRLIDIERAEPIAIDFKIDVNKADWPELALMPNIGEQLAKRIVTDRAERGHFRDHSDLLRVRGVGPRTLESMKPFLLPLPDLETTAASDADRKSAKVN